MYELRFFDFLLASMDICLVSRHLKLRPSFTSLEKFENAASFLQRGLVFKLNRHENRAFRNRSSNCRNLKTRALRFCVEEKHFRNSAFRER